MGKLLNITAYRHSRASREAVLAVMEWLDLAQKDPERWPGLETLLFNVLAARERAVWLEAAELYTGWVAGAWASTMTFDDYCREKAEEANP